ncbi:hypothetical protein KDI_54460 [Dictyobacter arantiisoli]|uniref:Uncharacterized protein n=2 Tax=Dictyobacter arantiisoli TaxID=2014874 RepID=A0A5A5TKS3_9CHLR|nr:hypothetical protein KDI_54460 [Dictyobacter arantiisoli]
MQMVYGILVDLTHCKPSMPEQTSKEEPVREEGKLEAMARAFREAALQREEAQK